VTKQEQFLWIVQTCIMANGINMSTQPEYADERRHQYSGVGAKNLMADAVRASLRIPNDLDATDAADDFCIFMVLGDRERRGECPEWFAALS